MLKSLLHKIKSMPRKKTILAAVILIGIALLAIWQFTLKNNQQKPIPVQGALAQTRPLQDHVFAAGRVRLVEKQEFYNYQETTVKKINVSPGDTVSAGEVLGILDAADLEDRLSTAKANYALHQANLESALHPRPEEIGQLQADLNKAQAGYLDAEKNYARMKELYENQAISAQELEKAQLELTNRATEHQNAQARLKIKQSGPTGSELTSLQAQVEQARSQMELAERQLARTTLTAEMDGVVIAVEVSEGDHINPGTRLITIGNTDKVEITAGINEADSGRLKTGQPVKVTAAAIPDRHYDGVLHSVSPGALVEKNNQGNQIEVPIIVRIDKDSAGLRPGYTVDLTITTVDIAKTLVVPYESVLERDGKRIVYVAENNIVKEKIVTTGLDIELYTEIKSGLKEGDTVIISPDDAIKEGARVAVTNDPAPTTGGHQP